MKDLVIIGNLAFQTEYLLSGKKYEQILGSAFYCSVAAKLIQANTGIVSRVGEDCKLSYIKTITTDISGITVVPKGKTARFTSYEKPGKRTFYEKPGVSKYFKTNEYPISFYKTKHVHLATMLPQNQLNWLVFLKSKLPKTTTYSVDAFEVYTKKYPELVLKTFKEADLIFLNQEEFDNLEKLTDFQQLKHYVLKKGGLGASYFVNNHETLTPAIKIKAINTSGAGEILATVFLLLRIKGIEVKKALDIAVFIASKSASMVDKLNLLNDSQVNNKLRNL